MALSIKHQPLYQKIISQSRESDSGCLEWQGCVQRNGYGRISLKLVNISGTRKSEYVHRAMYLAVHGELPKGIDICHACDNRKCIKPSHLFAGTRKENMEDAVRKGRQARGLVLSIKRRGEKCNFAKLSKKDVAAIRSRIADGERPKTIAPDFGISVDNVRKIRSGETWRNDLITSFLPRA